MPKGYSLHLGLNSVDTGAYGGWDGLLRACEADAHDMDALAKSLGYKRKVLLTKEATSANVVDEMLRLARKLTPADILFLTYSGHGGQIPDATSEEDDKYDETWCLYDRQLIDDELYRMFGLFKPGVRIIVLSDSCHSGTVTRARVTASLPAHNAAIRELARSVQPRNGGTEIREETRTRAAPLEVTLENYNKNRDEYISLQAASAGAEQRAPAAQVVLISGCQDNQESLDGSKNGLFTGTLKRVWDSGKFKGSYRLFHRTIVSRMPPTQLPNLYRAGTVTPDFMNQKPFSI